MRTFHASNDQMFPVHSQSSRRRPGVLCRRHRVQPKVNRPRMCRPPLTRWLRTFLLGGVGHLALCGPLVRDLSFRSPLPIDTSPCRAVRLASRKSHGRPGSPSPTFLSPILAPPLNPRYKGANGKESIPNFDFWTSIPGLIKDGFGFTISTVREKIGGGSEGYSSV